MLTWITGENNHNKINMDSFFNVLTNESFAVSSYSEAKIRCKLSAEGVYKNMLLLIADGMGTVSHYKMPNSKILLQNLCIRRNYFNNFYDVGRDYFYTNCLTL